MSILLFNSHIGHSRELLSEFSSTTGVDEHLGSKCNDGLLCQ